MTQLNENITLEDAKIFFPKSRNIFHRYGMGDFDVEEITLKRACELRKIDVYELLSQISQGEENFLYKFKDTSLQTPNKNKDTRS